MQLPSVEFALQLKVMMVNCPGCPHPPAYSWNAGMVMHVLKSDLEFRDLKHVLVYNMYNNYGGVMSVPKNPPYCLIYPLSYMKDMELDHFDTHNNPAGTYLHCCICHATLHYMNDNPHYCRAYGGSWLILPHGAQYKE